MSYCEAADCLDYTEGLVVDDPDAFARLCLRASRDVDLLLPAATGPLVGGLKVDPADPDLDADWLEALKRAACAQVEYRIEMGEEFFARNQYAVTQGPEFTLTGTLPYIGPKVRNELVAGGWVGAQAGTWRGVNWI